MIIDLINIITGVFIPIVCLVCAIALRRSLYLHYDVDRKLNYYSCQALVLSIAVWCIASGFCPSFAGRLLGRVMTSISVIVFTYAMVRDALSFNSVRQIKDIKAKVEQLQKRQPK